MEARSAVAREWGGENEERDTPRGFLPGMSSETPVAPNTDFCGYPSTTHFIKDLRKQLTGVVGIAEKLPQGEMNYLVCSTYSEFVEKVSTGSSQITSMMKNLSHYWGIPTATCRQFDAPQNKPAVMRGILETTKQLKERMDLTLDDLTRLKDDQSNGAGPTISVSPTKSVKGKSAKKPIAIARPQVAHGWKIDNSRNCFIPRIAVKHNALRSLDLSMAEMQPNSPAPHPYQFELDLFEPEESRLVTKPPIPAKKSDNVPLSYIDTLAEFQRALLELSSVKELAIDLEHHSYRTYLGFTCLIQISSRTKDYVIDSIALRDHIHELNSVFSNPKILKVFHGGNMDIQWLQRDFGVYVVNMFDTGQASRVLQLPRFSLAFLVQHYLGRILDKTHQMSDWRTRPLPDDMLEYARSDTHDLLYLYDCVRNDVIKKDPSLDLLRQVYNQSKAICLLRYEKQTVDVNDFAFIMIRFAKNFSEQQKFALKGILEWRDTVARDLDESIGFVLPTKACVDLAEELPRTSDDLVKCLEFVPKALMQRIHQMLELLRDARAFTGVVPVPIAENFVPMDVDSATEVIQRKVVRPLTSDAFASRYVASAAVQERSNELVWMNDNGSIGWSIEDPARMRLAHVWMHYLTIAAADKEDEETTPAFKIEKPNVKISVPLELPLVTTDAAPLKSDTNSAKKDTITPAFPGKSTGTTNTAAPLRDRTTVAASSSADMLPLPAKRQGFDYQSADYSKFTAGANPSQKRQAGKQHPGGLRNPNKRIDKQRNMTSESAGRFRKPQ